MSTHIGLRSLYPNLPGPIKLHGLAAAARPFTLLAPLIGILAGLLLALETHMTDWTSLRTHLPRETLGILALLLTQLGSNYLNQATDGREDAISKPYRPIPSGILTPLELAASALAAWVLALSLAGLTHPLLAAFLLSLMLLSYTYSAPPLRLKARPWMGNLGVALARGLLGIVTAYTIWAQPWNPTPWLAGTVLFLFLLGATTAKDLSDIDGDRTANVQTLPVRYGIRGAVQRSTPFLLTPLLTIPAYMWLTGLPLSVLGYGLILLGLTWMLILFWTRPNHENRILEGTRAWLAMYAMTMLIMLELASGWN